MRILPKAFKKVSVTVFLSTCLVSSFVAPAFGAIDANSLNNRISNELPAAFNVTAADVVDEVVLSWNENDPMDESMKNFNLTTGVKQTAIYYVSPKVGNDDDLTISVLLKIPSASVVAIGELLIDDEAVTVPAFTDGGFNYYALDEKILIAKNSAEAYSDSFDITFNQKNAVGTPFTASLIAVIDGDDVVEAIQTEAPDEVGFYTLPYSPGEMYETGTTADAQLFFYPKAGTVNGLAVIKLGDGIDSFNVTESSFTDPSVEFGSKKITDLTDYWDERTNTITVPISVIDFPRECYFDLVGVTFSSTPGNYTISVSVDQDGEGSGYSISDEVTTRYELDIPRK